MTPQADNLVARFNACVANHPARIAVSDPQKTLSYAELNACSNALAATISTSSTFVAICTEPSVHFIIAMLAALKAGKGWIYLDPAQPGPRLDSMLHDSGADVILVSNGGATAAAAFQGVRACVPIECDLAGEATAVSATAPAGPACLLYTSGSTGTPKGVVQTHENWLHVVDKAVNTLGINPDDRIAMISPPGHVVGIAAVMMGLMTGASVHIFDLAKHGFVELLQWIDNQEITYFHTVPTVFRRLLGSRSSADYLASVRMIAIGGELVTRQDIELFREKARPDAILRNSYGATEAIDTFQYLLRADASEQVSTIPIGTQGSPLDKLNLRNAEGQSAARGEPGEICIESAFLSPGYWQNPAATAEKFEVSDDSGERIYHTGDWGYLDLDGQLNYLSRTDDQVKIRGYRVELTDIEKNLRSLAGIKDVAVRHFTSARGETRLAAYVVTDLSTESIRQSLAEIVPEYMVPEAILKLPELPQNASGKIDKARLPDAFIDEAASLRYELEWVETSAPSDANGNHAQRVAVLPVGDQRWPELDTALAARGVATQIASSDLDVTDASVVSRFLSDAHKAMRGLDTIVIFEPASAANDDAEINTAQPRFRTAIELPIFAAQWLREHESDHEPNKPSKEVRLLVVTQRAICAAGEDRSLNLIGAAVAGLTQSIYKDMPSIRSRLLDFDALQTDESQAALQREISGYPEEEMITAYRAGQRLVRRIGSPSPRTVAQTNLTFNNSSFLVTGGLGSLGLAVARKLSDTGAACVYLAGRSKPGPAALKAIKELQAQGTDIQVRQLDVADRAQVDQLLAEIRSGHPPLKGIFHLAGSYHFQLLKDYDWETFQSVLAAKVDGSWNLHQSSQPDDLDIFVTASSVSAMFGFTGHAAYCAANSYMDGLGAARRQAGRPSLSINFGTLSGGMADSAAVQSWTAREGLNPISPEQAVNQMFDQLSVGSVVPGNSQTLIASIDLKKLLASRPEYDRYMLEKQIDITAEVLPDNHVLAAMEDEALIRLIMENWRGILPRKNFSPDDNFFDLGGDSLALIEGQLALTEALNIPVTVAEISDYPTASSLAAYLKRASREGGRPSALVPIRSNNQPTRLVVINSTREAKLLATLLPETVDVCSLNLFRLSTYMAEDDNEQMIPVLADLFTEDLCQEPAPENLFLFGFCQDALLTAEVALRLEARGIRVSGLILLDALFRDDLTNTPRERLNTIMEVNLFHYLAFYARRLPGAIRSRFRFGRAVPRYISSPVEKDMFDRYLREAFAREPAPLPTFIHHLVSSQWRLKTTSAYSRIAASGYDTLRIRGTHHGVWDSPFLEAMGGTIQRIIMAAHRYGADTGTSDTASS